MKKKTRELQAFKRILIFNVNWMGDVLFSTATIRNIRLNFPGSYIACVIPSRCYSILKGNPHLDEIIIFDEKDRHKGLLAKMDFVKLLKDKSFDVVFLLHRSFSRALLCRLAGIPARIGYYTKKRSFLLTRKIKTPAIDSMHRIDFYLNIIEKAGLRVEDRYTEFFFHDEDKQAVGEFLKDHGVGENEYLVLINPGGNWLLKRWPKEHWAILADRLIEEFKAKIIISGSPQDKILSEEIASLMKNKAILACGRLNIKQFAALSSRVELLITADTGPLHIGNACGVKKIIALFGPTSPEITGPYPKKNVIILRGSSGCKIPCYNVECKDNRCMKSISPLAVLEKIKIFNPR